MHVLVSGEGLGKTKVRSPTRTARGPRRRTRAAEDALAGPLVSPEHVLFPESLAPLEDAASSEDDGPNPLEAAHIASWQATPRRARRLGPNLMRAGDVASPTLLARRPALVPRTHADLEPLPGRAPEPEQRSIDFSYLHGRSPVRSPPHTPRAAPPRQPERTPHATPPAGPAPSPARHDLRATTRISHFAANASSPVAVGRGQSPFLLPFAAPQ